MGVILKLSENKAGRDFAVGDIHGCFSLLEEALAAADFDPLRDRVIGVGDLVDRGPESGRALEFLRQDWFYTVRGDHEHVIPDDIALMNSKGKDAVRDAYERDGMGWILALDDNEQAAFIEAFTALPYVIEVPLKGGGIAGFIHAEVPEGLSWQGLTALLEAGDDYARQTVLRGRSRIRKVFEKDYEDPGVVGIGKVFSGHSLAFERAVAGMGNWFCIDTGAVVRQTGQGGMPGGALEDCHLTLAEINADAETLCRKRPAQDSRAFHIIHAVL